MSTEDPNVRTDPTTGEQVVLEPGDEGYVEQAAPMPPPEPALTEEGEEVAPASTEGEVPPQDLRLVNEPGQSESEAIIAARGTVVESTSPSDIVPNTPQIRPFPPDNPLEEAAGMAVEAEGLATVEVTDEANTQQDLAAEEVSTERASAGDLVEQARQANTHQELDAIEAQADGRVTVINAVAERRAQL